MQKAKASKRFVALIIDNLIIGLISLLGLLIPINREAPIEPITNADTITYSDLYPYYLEHKDDSEGWNYYLEYGDENNAVFANYNYDGLMDQYKTYLESEEYRNYAVEELSYLVATLTPFSVISFILFIVIYIVIPMFWSKQTLGRMAMGIKVVTNDDEKPTLGNLIVRDFLGYQVLCSICCCGILYLINAIMCLTVDRLSLCDRMSGTKMVDTKAPLVDSELHFDNDNNSNNNDYNDNDDNHFFYQKKSQEPEEVEVVDTIKEDKKKDDSDDLWN